MPKHETADSRASAIATVKPFQFRGRFLTAVALRLEGGPPDERFYEALDEQLRQTPHFLANAPLILDLEKATDLTAARDLSQLVENLRSRKLSTFAVQNASAEQISAAAKAGLISVSTGHDAPLKTDNRERRKLPEADGKKPRPTATRVVTAPVRSGQTIFSEDGDIVVVGPVASGAELIAGGNIHVYGPLRGRAMAGVHGDKTARIFCQSIDAELLAIAGLYRTSENLEHDVRKRSVHIYLQDDRLCVEVLA